MEHGVVVAAAAVEVAAKAGRGCDHSSVEQHGQARRVAKGRHAAHGVTRALLHKGRGREVDAFLAHAKVRPEQRLIDAPLAVANHDDEARLVPYPFWRTTKSSVLMI